MSLANTEIMRFAEKKRHGDALLPFVIYGTMMPTLYTSFPLHCHEEVEMVLVDCGTCRYTISGENVDLHFGDILVMMPWVLHSFRLAEKDAYFLASTFLISLDMINNQSVDICSSRYFSPMLNRACSDYCVVRPGAADYEEIRTAVVAMFDTYFEHGAFFELKLKGLISDLFYRLLDGGYIRIHESTPETADVKVVRQVVDYITEHYGDNITLGGLAQLVNLSETGLSRLFRSVTGMSCIDYVIEYRLSQAISMLRTTKKPIIEIAFETGFNHISYFNRTFKKHFGQTPSACRKSSAAASVASEEATNEKIRPGSV